MLMLKYLLGIAFFCGVFELGNLLIDHDRSWAGSLKRLMHRSASADGLSSFFRYSGRIFQVVAAVWGFVDAVAIMVLFPTWITGFMAGQ